MTTMTRNDKQTDQTDETLETARNAFEISISNFSSDHTEVVENIHSPEIEQRWQEVTSNKSNNQ